MKAIIVEDENAVLNLLKNMLITYCKSIEIVGEAKDMLTAKKLIQAVKPDLVFLDIELPQGSGFELLKQVSEINFKVIFTTAHEKYALQAIKFSALDYLLKPIDPEELVQAVKKAQGEIQKDLNQLKLQTLLKNLEVENHKEQQIILRDKYGLHLIDIKDIYHLEAVGSYTQFYIKDRQPLLISKNIKEYEILLKPHNFFRCHKSYLVNMDHFKSYNRQGGDKLILKNGSTVPLATRKKEELMTILKKKANIN